MRERFAPTPSIARVGRVKAVAALKRIAGWREVGIRAQFLRDLGVRSIALMSSSERQYVRLGGFGIAISERIVLK